MKINSTEPLCSAGRKASFFTHSTLVFLMRVSFVYSVLVLFSITMLFAHVGKSQSLEEIKVTIELNNETLPQLFQKIQNETGLLFAYREQETDKVSAITLPRQTLSVKAILDIAFTNTKLQYRKSGSNVIVFEEQLQIDEQPIRITVIGIVKDKEGSPLPGVSVFIKGTTTGTTTDANGRYSLSLPPGGDKEGVLVFSFIGKKSFESPINSQSVIDVTLEDDTNVLQEVQINAGYYNVTKTTSTASIARLDAKEIEKQPVLNPLQSLQGRLTGVYIQQQNGLPNSQFFIQIRGINSLRGAGASQPLVVIDGVPFTNTSISSGASGGAVPSASPLNAIDPASIESIEILKDADATSIYGSQGSNGVLLITTKKGKPGRTTASASFSAGFAQVPHFMKLLNTKDYVTMRKEALANDGLTISTTRDIDIAVWDTTRYTNWQKVLIGGTGKVYKTDISISGGSTNTSFLIRGSFSKQTTVFPTDLGFSRNAGHFNLNHQSQDKKFSLTFSTDFSSNIDNLPGGDLQLTESALKLAPNAPKLYTENGELNWENGTWDFNPMANLENKYEGKTKGFFINNTISYEILKGLKIKANMGYNALSQKDWNASPISSAPPKHNPSTIITGHAYFGTSVTETWVIEPQVDFSKKIWLGEFSMLAGSTFRNSINETLFILGSKYTNDALLKDLLSAPLVSIQNSQSSQYRYNAFFGRINYNVEHKYLVNLTARRDGSSRFGPNNKFGNFWAVGAAWIFSNESFVKDNAKWLSFGKMRSSYGTTGNDQIGDYQYIETYTPITPSYQSTDISIIPTRIANQNYSWEVNKKFEAALELGFVDDRIDLSVNFYNNNCSNQLVGQSIPGTTGFTKFQNNLAATIQNRGWEFEVSATNISTEVFRWTTSLNLTIPETKLVAYPGIEKTSDVYEYEVGKSMLIRKTLHYLGLDPLTGVYTFQDVDGDGSSNGNLDKRALVKNGKQFFGGLQNSISFHGLELSFFFQFTKQTRSNYLFGDYGAFRTQPGAVFDNQPAFVMNRWQQPGDVTSIQKFTTGSEGSTARYDAGRSDYAISDASFIKLQNASLTWRIPSTVLKKIGIAEASVFVLGQNLFTVTNFFGFDPDFSSFKSLPPLRTITIGGRISL